MGRKSVFAMTLMIVLINVSAVSLELQRAKAGGTIYIRADGSIDPPTSYIQRDGEVYTFTSDISDSIVIQKDDIILDGAGYTLQGTNFAGTGIHMQYRSNITIKNMKIAGFDFGTYIFECSKSTIISNNITGNRYGVYLLDSSENELRNNRIFNNTWNFFVFGPRLEDFLNDIDDTNTVDGKPMYYWTDEADRSVPSNAGFVALVSCTRITVENASLSNNGQGILLAYTTNSTIIKNTLQDNIVGIRIRYSSGNILYDNIITSNNFGVELDISSKNNISANSIVDNPAGLDLSGSTANTISENNIVNSKSYGLKLHEGSNDNTISANNITNNNLGMRFEGSSSNRIYNNSFINNMVQVATSNSVNFWDSGYPSGGNYWSDYTERYPNASEIDGSGIWDTPYIIDQNNQDNYPIIPQFPSFLSLIPLFMLATLLAIIVSRKA